MVLASIRQKLVEHVEALYKSAPSRRSLLRQLSANVDHTQRLDIVLDRSLLSLGRCIDIVRPGGLHVGSVTTAEYKRALRDLDKCMSGIRTFCDPDHEIDYSEWGTMGPDKAGDTSLEVADEDVEQEIITASRVMA